MEDGDTDLIITIYAAAFENADVVSQMGYATIAIDRN
jgi:hypothetical protein